MRTVGRSLTAQMRTLSALSCSSHPTGELAVVKT